LNLWLDDCHGMLASAFLRLTFSCNSPRQNAICTGCVVKKSNTTTTFWGRGTIDCRSDWWSCVFVEALRTFDRADKTRCICNYCGALKVHTLQKRFIAAENKAKIQSDVWRDSPDAHTTCHYVSVIAWSLFQGGAAPWAIHRRTNHWLCVPFLWAHTQCQDHLRDGDAHHRF